MAVLDRKIHKNANVARDHIAFEVATVVSLTDAKVGAYKPGFAFQVVGVQVFARTVTATISVQVKIGTVSVLTGAVTPVAATLTEGTLSGTLANVRGSKSDTIFVELTTNASGAATNLGVVVIIRPVPLNAEIATE
jgi:hypothetical protein